MSDVVKPFASNVFISVSSTFLGFLVIMSECFIIASIVSGYDTDREGSTIQIAGSSVGIIDL